MKIESKLNRIPPYAYRLLAKIRVPSKQGFRIRELSSKEIAQRSGLHFNTIEYLSRATSWGGITISTADKFIQGCGFDPLKQRKALFMLKRISRSKNGILGVRHLAMTSQLPIWEKSSRRSHIVRLKQVLMEASNAKQEMGADPKG